MMRVEHKIKTKKAFYNVPRTQQTRTEIKLNFEFLHGKNIFFYFLFFFLCICLTPSPKKRLSVVGHKSPYLLVLKQKKTHTENKTKQNKARTKQNKIYTLTGRLWKGNLSLLSVDPRVAKSTVLHPYSTSSI